MNSLPLFAMAFVAKSIVVTFCLVLLVLAGSIFAKQPQAERFFMSFASSARAHYIEQAFRLLIGTSLIVASSGMWRPSMFHLIGSAIVIPTIALLLMPWQWHHRFGTHVLPLFNKYIHIYAVGMVAFACLLLFGIFAGSTSAQ